jgi:hypothetical protein
VKQRALFRRHAPGSKLLIGMDEKTAARRSQGAYQLKKSMAPLPVRLMEPLSTNVALRANGRLPSALRSR